MDLQLAGKRALVTGGSRGIGLRIARSLLAEGADVAIAARDGERLAQAAAELAAAGHPGRIVSARLDTGDDTSVRAGVQRIREQLGGDVAFQWDATGLVCEIAAAVTEAGLPLHETAPGSTAGGVCLLPAPGAHGVLVSWRPHERLSLQQVRGAAVDSAVQRTMNAAVADLLTQLGFRVEPTGSAGCSLVLDVRSWA